MGTPLEVECEACGQLIPTYDTSKHAAGLDPQRPECPRQDIEKIKLAEGQGSSSLRGQDAW